MPFAAGVKFRSDSFSKYYDPGATGLAVDDFCLVNDVDLNMERIGFVSILEGRAPIQMEHLPKVLRTATEEEVEQWYELRIREKEMTAVARESSRRHKLDIKISEVTLAEEDRKVLIHFTSEKRIDFREMVKDLAAQFKARIEMWQIGARKEAGIKNGLGICGNPLCCGNWLKDYPSISMRHARDQDIVQPPSKLSGPCNRLRCCLRYEHETYVELRTGAPATGCKGCASGGACGIVIDRNLLKQEVTLKAETGGYTTVPFAEFQVTQEAAPRRSRDRPRGRGGRPPREAREGNGERRGERGGERKTREKPPKRDSP